LCEPAGEPCIKNGKIKLNITAEDYGVQVVLYDEIASLLINHNVTYEMILKRLQKERYRIG
jgi:hypothetical protein